MEFNARLSMIINEYQSGKISSETAINKFERMLKDEKNIDYFDRIYFSIAEVYLKNNDEAKGVEYLELALQQQGSSNVQQGETHLKLARIYYQKENYLKAADYYQKALSSLSKSDDRYSEVERLSTSLRDIASRIQTINLQDSLLKISAMSIDEKRAFAFDMKKKQDEDRRNALKDAAKTPPTSIRGQVASRRVTAATPIAGPSALAGATKSNWFAYDDRAVKRGKRDFSQTWGARTLEDDWRRSNRTKTTASVATLDSTTSNQDLTSSLLSDDQVANVLKGVPQSKTQIEEAGNTLMTALFELGVLYRDRLKNLQKSVETFEQLLARFPDTKYKAEAMYYLYLLHKEIGNPINAQNYFDRLVSECPNSIYAKILNDPDYLAKIQNEERKLNDFYDDTYDMFSGGNFQGAFNNLQQVESKFGVTNVLQPRFALLTAMTLGKLEGKDAYIRTLKEVVAKYPNTDEQKRAREILRLLGDTASGLAGLESTAADDGNFIFEPDEAHYIIIALTPDASLTDAKVVVSDFNRKYYKLENLRITNIFLENEGKERTPLVVIRRFKTQKEAMDYYNNTKLNIKDFLQDVDYQIFPVTQNNYSEIIKTKNLEAYREFFEDKYL
jgi:tetratricopeptide (TPR) repeat protein